MYTVKYARRLNASEAIDLVSFSCWVCERSRAPRRAVLAIDPEKNRDEVSIQSNGGTSPEEKPRSSKFSGLHEGARIIPA